MIFTALMFIGFVLLGIGYELSQIKKAMETKESPPN